MNDTAIHGAELVSSYRYYIAEQLDCDAKAVLQALAVRGVLIRKPYTACSHYAIADGWQWLLFASMGPNKVVEFGSPRIRPGMEDLFREAIADLALDWSRTAA